MKTIELEWRKKDNEIYADRGKRRACVYRTYTLPSRPISRKDKWTAEILGVEYACYVFPTKKQAMAWAAKMIAFFEGDE